MCYLLYSHIVALHGAQYKKQCGKKFELKHDKNLWSNTRHMYESFRESTSVYRHVLIINFS